MSTSIFHSPFTTALSGSAKETEDRIRNIFQYQKKRPPVPALFLACALALWVRALHWFNPLVWLTARAMDRDIELSCDESALKHLPPAEHAAYGRTILSAVSALTGAGRPQSASISDSEF